LGRDPDAERPAEDVLLHAAIQHPGRYHAGLYGGTGDVWEPDRAGQQLSEQSGDQDWNHLDLRDWLRPLQSLHARLYRSLWSCLYYQWHRGAAIDARHRVAAK